MSAKAYVEADWIADGVKIAVILRRSEATSEVMTWAAPTARVLDAHAAAPDDAFLRLPDDIARALYEALSVHFGGNVVDATRLRKDYDAERARVDLFIKHTVGGAR